MNKSKTEAEIAREAAALIDQAIAIAKDGSKTAQQKDKALAEIHRRLGELKE